MKDVLLVCVMDIFCKIVNGNIPAKVVHENQSVLVFHDIDPKAPLHLLVIPKKHYDNFHDFQLNAPENEKTLFWQAVEKIITEHKLHVGGYKLITNMGDFGQQEVPHFHLHILADQLAK